MYAQPEIKECSNCKEFRNSYAKQYCKQTGECTKITGYCDDWAWQNIRITEDEREKIA